MFPWLHQRPGHYLLLLLVTAALTLPNLGGPSLWDIDEGNNSEAAREMLESRNLVVPTFNYELRVDKPALLYWLQIGAYEVLGVNELSARLPSAMAALVAVLAAYELGRRMFGAAAGLLTGLILASTPAFCAAAHFANPDALLNACTILTFLCFWQTVSVPGRMRFVLLGACMGLAVLAKGPVGLILPFTVGSLYLLWNRQWHRLRDLRLLWGCLAFVLVAGPWYAWVGVETKAEFLSGFWTKHHWERFWTPLEHHNGPMYYYGFVLVLGLLPWSVFLGPTLWYGAKALWRSKDEASAGAETELAASRLLWCWIAVYLVFFSLAATKLPNYILPVYAPLAILTARYLDWWRTATFCPWRGVMASSLVLLAVLGASIGVALLWVGGALPGPRLHGGPIPALTAWSAVGAVLLVGGLVSGWYLVRHQRKKALVAVTVSAILFIGALGAGSSAVEPLKAPRSLAQTLPEDQTLQEIRVGSYEYFQPSLVFYCQREVERLNGPREVQDFLRGPLPSYLFVPATVWEDELRPRVRVPCRLLKRRHDLYRNCDVVVVTNR
jgi:4-amino-4-deoxy-L-arabinose transferase-like glycosyltransferase